MKSKHQISYSRSFIKQLEQAPTKIKIAFLRRRDIFEQNPNHPQLRNHALSGKRKGLRSINVTGDWRALYAVEAGTKNLEIIALFQAIGTHSQLYK